MKRILKILRRRYLLLLPLVVLAGLFIELTKKRLVLECLYCGATGERNYVAWWVFGWASESEGVREIENHRFFEDYPEFSCHHHFNFHQGTDSFYWNSPLLEQGSISSQVWSTRSSKLVKRYARDDEFSDALRTLEAKGLVSRDLILRVANSHCSSCWYYQIPDDPERLHPLTQLMDSPEKNKK